LSKIAISLLLSTAVVYSTASQANIYVNAGGYFSTVSKPVKQQGDGSSIGIGYVINSSWSAELSYDNLIDEAGSSPALLKKESPYPLDWENGYQSKGWTISALGKAAINPSASLFYRIGLIYNDFDYSIYTQGNNSCEKEASGTEIYKFVDEKNKLLQQATGCRYIDTSTQLLFGLGVEGDFSQNWFGRIEAIHFFAKKGEPITAAKLSVGYRF
jgi:hypothetical protein